MTFFGLRSGQDLENRAAHLHQEFPAAGVYPRGCLQGLQIETTSFNMLIRGSRNSFILPENVIETFLKISNWAFNAILRRDSIVAYASQPGWLKDRSMTFTIKSM